MMQTNSQIIMLFHNTKWHVAHLVRKGAYILICGHLHNVTFRDIKFHLQVT